MTHNAPVIEESPKSKPSRRRFAAILVVAAAILVLAIFASGMLGRGPAPLTAQVDPLKPDLVMAPIEEVTGGLQEFTGAPVVRVEATIANKGVGDFVLSAKRDWPWSGSWTVYQQIAEAAGGYTEWQTPADLIFTGAPHSHWHVRDMEAHRLERIDTGEVLSEVIKQGFCPFDTDLYYREIPGAPTSPVYLEPGCEGPVWTTSLAMGVSKGWGDKYPWHMVEQSIDITGIPDGAYRIREIADPFDWFEESDETNNETWIDIEILTVGGIPTVNVIARAP